jgi:hypothetical protein
MIDQFSARPSLIGSSREKMFRARTRNRLVAAFAAGLLETATQKLDVDGLTPQRTLTSRYYRFSG